MKRISQTVLIVKFSFLSFLEINAQKIELNNYYFFSSCGIDSKGQVVNRFNGSKCLAVNFLSESRLAFLSKIDGIPYEFNYNSKNKGELIQIIVKTPEETTVFFELDKKGNLRSPHRGLVGGLTNEIWVKKENLQLKIDGQGMADYLLGSKKFNNKSWSSKDPYENYISEKFKVNDNLTLYTKESALKIEESIWGWKLPSIEDVIFLRELPIDQVITFMQRLDIVSVYSTDKEIVKYHKNSGKNLFGSFWLSDVNANGKNQILLLSVENNKVYFRIEDFKENYFCPIRLIKK
jgi:hypothetical protein